jgi:hypothetical protein
MWLLILLLLLLLLHIRLQLNLARRRCGNTTVNEFVSGLRNGDVILLCGQKAPLASLFEVFLRPLLYWVFGTCFLHPVYVTQDGAQLKVVHWAGESTYSNKRSGICSNQRGPNVHVDTVDAFFASHLEHNGPSVKYRVYRSRSGKTPPPFSTVMQYSETACGLRAGDQMQCFKFLLQLLRHTGYVQQDEPDTRGFPSRIESLLADSNFRMVNQVTVCFRPSQGFFNFLDRNRISQSCSSMT